MRTTRALVVLTVVAACDPAPRQAPPPASPSAPPPRAGVARPLEIGRPSRAVSVVTPDMDAAARAFYGGRADEFAAERLLALETGGRVTRAGGTLRLRLGTGRTATFVDDLAEGSAFRRHLYRGHLRALGVHVVEVGFYEGGEYLVYHDATGAHVRVPDVPVPSPDGLRFAVGSVDLHAGYAPNVLQVWRVTASGIVREHELDGGEEWGPAELAWDGFARLRFVEERQPPGDAGGAPLRTPAALVLADGRWTLER
jgi:hypothetical protein